MNAPGFDPDTLERLVPHRLTDDALSRATLELHLERYRFAAAHCLPGRVLDIACGVGYGSACLAGRREDVQITGVDLSPEAIRFAREHYASDRVVFEVGDAMAFSSPHRFGSIVSLETVEHLPDPAGFVAGLVPLLEAGGRFIASVPTTPSVDGNPHHLHDFTRRKLHRLVAPFGFTEIASFPQVQPFGLRSVLTRGESRTKDVRRNLPAYYLRHPGSLARRIASTLRHGFANLYLTVAWRAPGGERGT